MKYGIREVCNMNFYKYINGDCTNLSFTIDSAKTSTLDSSTTTVYAQGGWGNARLMAWEGERTLIFTVEDALFTKASLAALFGENFSSTGSLSLKTTSTSGTYRITAETLVRDENGTDHAAIITIHKAKLQSNLNLPFSPTGDPMAFTFTFDAFPVNDEFLTFTCPDMQNDVPEGPLHTTTVIIIDKNGSKYELGATISASDNEVAVQFKLNAEGKAELGVEGNEAVSEKSYAMLYGPAAILTKAGDVVNLPLNSHTVWYEV